MLHYQRKQFKIYSGHSEAERHVRYGKQAQSVIYRYATRLTKNKLPFNHLPVSKTITTTTKLKQYGGVVVVTQAETTILTC